MKLLTAYRQSPLAQGFLRHQEVDSRSKKLRFVSELLFVWSYECSVGGTLLDSETNSGVRGIVGLASALGAEARAGCNIALAAESGLDPKRINGKLVDDQSVFAPRATLRLPPYCGGIHDWHW